MPVKARRCLACLAVPVFLAVGIARAQQDTSVPAGGQTVTGRVVDAQGRPLSGVEVWRPHTLQEKIGRAQRRPAAVSGPDGRFTVSNLRPQEALTACPAEWLPAEVRPEAAADKPLEIRLQPAARLVGRVVDGRGEPVPGLDVTAQLAGWSSGGCLILGPSEPCSHPQYRSGPTDADGRFVFEGLEPGWFTIRASDGTGSQVVRWQALPGKSGRQVEVALPGKLVPLEGRVVDADGKPVSGAQVSTAAARPDSQTQTDEDGVYRFSHAFSGSSRLHVIHPDFGWIQQEILIGESPSRADIRMPAATVVEGRIFTRDGSPIAKPRLSVDFRDVELDPEGHFRFHVSPGEHEVRLEAVGWITAQRPVTATGDPIELSIEVSRPATLSGRVTGLAPGGFATLELLEGPQTRYGGKGAGEDGRFDLYLVAPGAWTLVARDNNGRTLKRRIQVEEGKEITVEDFSFPPLPPVRGRVLDPEGRGIRHASVFFEQGELRIHAVTDAEGRFTAYLVDGAWTAKAEQKGLGSTAATVTVAGSPVVVPDLRLARTVAASGYVRGLAPGEIPLVQATSEDGLWTRGTQAGQDLSFQIPDLWPGTWTLTAMLDGRKASTQVRILPGDTVVRADVSFGGN
ncbi:MAG: hypothetical protein QOH06_5770 [Acidobacteriota bacterium]|jgi:protocatechuate 3,4-dioxygenase beta subunit|nr:hypothetical protein [Acidobacteriota bacterium]